MAQKRLLVDLDGTLARFHDEVNYLERMFEKGFFGSLEPFENMVEGIRLFIQNNPDVQVYSCSAQIQSLYCQEEKDAWLDRYLPEISKENRIYTEMGRSKAEYLPGGCTKENFLLDDYNRGLHKFLFDGGSAIKCHNNINQKGRGDHGGERGYMWAGPMIHANDPPELIAAELAQLMGLEHDIKKAAKACNVPYKEAEKKLKFKGRGAFKTSFITPVQKKGRIHYLVPDMNAEMSWTFCFLNPFNALRWLNNDPLSSEYTLQTSEGETVTVSGYQLEAICQNAYGNGDFQKYMRADSTQLADDVKLALSHRGDAVVGFLGRVDPKGNEYDLTPYFDHKSMLQQIETCERLGEAYHMEWFIEPSAWQHGSVKEKDQLPFTNLLEDANRRIMEAQNGATWGEEPELQ